MDLKDKTILVTGGGSGIGLALAKGFAAAGAKVIICGRTQSKLDAVVKDNPDLIAIACDISKEEDVLRLKETVDTEHGGIDVLVNNAGIFQSIAIGSGNVSVEHQRRELDIDLFAPIRLIELFLPDLKKRPGSGIVNVSSGLAYVPLAIAPVYCAAKAGMHSYTISLREQLKTTGIKVFEILAPVVDTEMTANMDTKKMKPDDLAKMAISALQRDKFEIRPGISGSLYAMSRLMPKFMFKQLTKSFPA